MLSSLGANKANVLIEPDRGRFSNSGRIVADPYFTER